MFTHPRRMISAALAVVLGVAFVAAALFIGNSLSTAMERTVAGAVGDATVVVSRDKNAQKDVPTIPDSYVASVRAVPGVTEVRERVSRVLFQDLGGHRGAVNATTVPRLGAGTQLVSGRLPQKAGEVAVNPTMVNSRQIREGDEIRLAPDMDAPTRSTRVVGVVTGTPGPNGLPAVFAANADLKAWASITGVDELHVIAAGADDAAVLAKMKSLPTSESFVLRTGAEEKTHQLSKQNSVVTMTTRMLMGFAAVSVLVSSIVIANTFSILVAQRVRELALLRCVGATRRQVFRSVLREAFLLSAVSSVVGVLLGAAAAAGLSALSANSPSPMAGLVLTVQAVLVPMVIGIVVTVAAAAVPARRATRVAPMAALRPEFAPLSKTRAGRFRIGCGVLAFVAGTAALIIGATSHQLPLGILGGTLSVLGVVMLGSLIVPPLAGILGMLPARLAGMPGELAVENSRRNPARAAATTNALFIGVALITMMSVGAATGQASINQEIDRRAPVDAIVSSEKGLTAAVIDRVKRSSAVAATDEQFTGTITMTSAEPSRTFQERAEVHGVGSGAAAVIRSSRMVDGVRADTVLLGKQQYPAIPDGAKVKVEGETGQSRVLTAVVRESAGQPLLDAKTLRSIVPDARPLLAVRFADDQDAQRANEKLKADLAGENVRVGGTADARAQLNKGIQALLYVVSGLLAVAVLIALVGVGNTLALSVLERTRESGLLRALGVTRRQIRRMLGIEALTLSAVGTVLGVVLGIGYGIAGTYPLLGRQMSIVVTIPWDRLALVAAVALVAGWVASVVPGRRAAKVPPSAALMTE